MPNPEKFNSPQQEHKKTPDDEKAKIEFMAWKETLERRMQGERILSKEKQTKFLSKVDPYSLDPEDMGWDRKIRSKDFDPKEFKVYQDNMIERAKKKGRDDSRFNFMRSLIGMAEEELEMREWRKKIK